MKNNLQTNQNETLFFETKEAKIAFDIISSSHLGSHRQLLFLINGFQRTRHDFRAFRQKIVSAQEDLITIAFDNRFCGETVVLDSSDAENIHNISLLEFARDALELLNNCVSTFQPRSIYVLGISMGGMIAQLLATLPKCPTLNVLFLVSTTAGGVHRVWPNVPFLQKNPPQNVEESLSFEERFAVYFGKKFLESSPLLFKVFVQNIKKTSEQSDNRHKAKIQEHASKNFEGVNNFNVLNAQKTVIITGDEDQIMPPKNAEKLHELIPNSDLIVYPGIGHLILIENSNKFVHDVMNYLRTETESVIFQ